MCLDLKWNSCLSYKFVIRIQSVLSQRSHTMSYKYTHTCTYTRTQAHAHTYTHNVHTYSHTHAHAHTHTHTHIHTHIHTHTHTHTVHMESVTQQMNKLSFPLPYVASMGMHHLEHILQCLSVCVCVCTRVYACHVCVQMQLCRRMLLLGMLSW